MQWGLLICALPIVLAFAATVIGGLLGCSVNEGGSPTCLFMGIDISGVLTNLFIMHWFGMITLPIAALLVVVWILVEIVNLIRRWVTS